MMTNRLLILSLILFTFGVQAKASRHEYSFDAGITQITKQGESKTAFTNRGRYNYYFSPFWALDINYTRMQTTELASFNPNSDTSAKTEYDAFGAGIKLNQPIGKRFNVFAATGLSYSNVSEESENKITKEKSSDKESSFDPYFNAGLMFNPGLGKNVNFSIDYTYQNLGLDYTASYISVGAHLTF